MRSEGTLREHHRASATRYEATFVEVGGAILGGSCGSATISGAGHVACQCVYFDKCMLVMQESVVGAWLPGSPFAAGANAPLFLQITQTIVEGTGRFAGATGGGTGRINTAADAVIN